MTKGAAVKKNGNSVGVSEGRTPFKHDLMNRILGQTIGACAYGSARIRCARRWHVDDLCAGDGVISAESGRCSPQIIRHHLNFKTGGAYLRSTGGSATATLWERDAESFSRLRELHGDDPNITLRNEDSSAFEWGIKDDAVRVVIADPNNIDQIPLRRAFYDDHMPVFGSLLVTMGCNASGLKRLPRERREEWLAVADIGAVKRRNHEAILVTLNGDSSQWAYLFVFPNKWAQQLCNMAELSAIGNGTAKAPGYWKQGVDIVRYNVDGAGAWRAAFERLVLTRQELLCRDQPGLWPDVEEPA